MDLDALSAARRDEWARLEELSRTRRLSGSEVDELVIRYRAASADLADIKTSAGRTAQGDHVSTMLARARLRLTGTPENVMRQIPRFFALQLPAALYRVRWTTLVIALAFIAVGTIVAFWVSRDPALVASLGSRAELEYYAENSFTDYYSENPAAVFAGTVWTNNAWIAAQCVLFGITGVWPLMVLVQNAVGVGTAAAVMLAFDRGDVFLLFILPHGMLELTSIFVAGAAGLHIFWAWVAPGRRTRAEALAAAGRSLATIVVGLIIALAISGVIEGFVTAQPWPWPVKIGIGAAALAAF
ncbi:MAG TPA: stage II sporulation protein M, partial [Microbacterium sp.]|nr:stage II sporulation protein M [Microbacterium sp.]